MSDSYFEQLETARYLPTKWCAGAWNEEELHFSPVAGLITHELEQFLLRRDGDSGAGGLVFARLSFDILGVVTFDPIDIEVQTIRPGRTIELLEVVLVQNRRAAVRARVWRLMEFDTAAVEGGLPEALPHPDSLADQSQMTSVWPGNFIRSLSGRIAREPVPGRGALWLSTDIHLVEGAEVSNLAYFVGLSDTANGVAIRESPTEWMYPNIDLSLSFYRQPRGRWIGFDTTVTFGASGQGLTASILHDEHGPVGRAAQTLTVRSIG